MRERKQHMEDLADAFIIAPGGIGTFEEFFEILTLKQLRRHDKPIIIFNVNGFYNELINTLRNAVDNGFIKSRCMELFCCTDSAEKAVALAAAPVASDLTVGDLKEG